MSEFGFKFEIGQLVESVASIGLTEEAWHSRQKWLVVERIWQQCPGGVQRHYVCRGVHAHGSLTLEYVRINEIELQSTKTFEEDAAERRAAAKVAYVSPEKRA